MNQSEKQRVIERIETILRQKTPHKIEKEGDFIRASVMIILRGESEGFSMLFIKRPESARDVFSGQMAFPGGKVKPEDRDREDTAVRETLEETGVNIRRSGRILGELDEFKPINPQASHYVVSPFLAILTEEVEVKPNEEVAEFVWIPLSYLADEANHEARFLERHGARVQDHVYRYGSYVIWGMTGRMLFGFLSAVNRLF